MKTAPLLSIGMIFKNEARCLERCLQSLQPLRDAIPCELIMADTGSDDGSRAIAEQYADEVFDFAWCDDFAAARNAVIDRCHGEWYFSVDSDEWLDADISELLSFLRGKRKGDSAFVIVRNYESAELEKGDNFEDFCALRLLWLPCGRRYQGTIHEQFGYREPAIRLMHTILHHDGYVYISPEAKNKKMQRNMKLLRQRLEQEPGDLRTLLQCIESGRQTPDFFEYIRRGIAAIQAESDEWKTYGPCILRHAVNAARIHELPEREAWTEYAQKKFPDSIFTLIDLNYSEFLSAHKEKEWEKLIRSVEGYRRGLRELRATHISQKTEEELGHSNLMFSSRPMERYALIGLADAFLHTGQGEKSLKLLAGLEGVMLSPEQVRIATIVFCNLHAWTRLDVSDALASFYGQISRNKPDEQSRKARLASFHTVCAGMFTQRYQKEEQEQEGYHRPGYTAFRCLAGQCEAGRAAELMTAIDPAEIRDWLLKVEDWQALPIEALEYALREGMAFPLPEKPLNIEVLNGLAARLTRGENMARQLTLSLSENGEYLNQQSLFWVQSLAMAALRGFDWSLGKNDAPVSKFACPEKKQDADKAPVCTPEEGLALLRRFAQIESAVLPILYTPQALAEENAALLPPMHRWGLYCTRALEALDGGNPQEYLAILRRGLAACPGEKAMVQFLLDRFVEDARPKASPELLALAEKVRTILAAYGPNDPAVAALKESPAYKQVAWIIEQGPSGQKVQ